MLVLDIQPYKNTNGSNNIALGLVMYENTDGNHNIALGQNTLNRIMEL